MTFNITRRKGMTGKQVLLKELKKAGLNIAEESVLGVVEAVFDALPKFLAATENKVDDVLIAVLPIVKPHVLAAVDKIDGEEDRESAE